MTSNPTASRVVCARHPNPPTQCSTTRRCPGVCRHWQVSRCPGHTAAKGCEGCSAAPPNQGRIAHCQAGEIPQGCCAKIVIRGAPSGWATAVIHHRVGIVVGRSGVGASSLPRRARRIQRLLAGMESKHRHPTVDVDVHAEVSRTVGVPEMVAHIGFKPRNEHVDCRSHRCCCRYPPTNIFQGCGGVKVAQIHQHNT